MASHQNPATEWPGAFPSFKLGFDAITKNLQFAFIYVAVNAVGAFLTFQNPHSGRIAIIASVLPLVLIAAFTKYSLATARGKNLPLDELFKTTAPEFLRL